MLGDRRTVWDGLVSFLPHRLISAHRGGRSQQLVDIGFHPATGHFHQLAGFLVPTAACEDQGRHLFGLQSFGDAMDAESLPCPDENLPDHSRSFLLHSEPVGRHFKPGRTRLEHGATTLTGRVAGLLPAVPPAVTFHGALFVGTGEDDKRLDQCQGVGGVGRVFAFGLECDDGDAEVLESQEQLQGGPDLVTAEAVEGFDDEHAAAPDATHPARFQEAGERPLAHVVASEGTNAEVLQGQGVVQGELLPLAVGA
jgi:hypothetical protein